MLGPAWAPSRILLLDPVPVCLGLLDVGLDFTGKRLAIGKRGSDICYGDILDLGELVRAHPFIQSLLYPINRQPCAREIGHPSGSGVAQINLWMVTASQPLLDQARPQLGRLVPKAVRQAFH